MIAFSTIILIASIMLDMMTYLMYDHISLIFIGIKTFISMATIMWSCGLFIFSKTYMYKNENDYNSIMDKVKSVTEISVIMLTITLILFLYVFYPVISVMFLWLLVCILVCSYLKNSINKFTIVRW